MKASVASHLSGDLFVAIPGVSCIATFKDLLQVCKKNGICLVEAFDMDGKLLPKEVEKGMANATDRYIFSDTGDDALHEIVTKFPDMFVYADEDRIALRSEWQHDDKKLPMAYFDFGYSAADIEQLCAAAKKHCTTQNEQLPSCANRVE